MKIKEEQVEEIFELLFHVLVVCAAHRQSKELPKAWEEVPEDMTEMANRVYRELPIATFMLLQRLICLKGGYKVDRSDLGLIVYWSEQLGSLVTEIQMKEKS